RQAGGRADRHEPDRGRQQGAAPGHRHPDPRRLGQRADRHGQRIGLNPAVIPNRPREDSPVRTPRLRRRARAALPAPGLLAALAHPASAADKGTVTVDKIEYKGWKNNLRFSNGEAEVIVTLDVGPRIISYRLKDGKNVFWENPDELGKSGEKEWRGRG